MNSEYREILNTYVAENVDAKHATAISMLVAENEYLTLRNSELEQETSESNEKRAAAEYILFACIKKFEMFGKYNTADKLRALFYKWVKPPAPPKQEAT